MISLRHHVISLAAVFLALTVGILLGSGVLSGPLLSGLRADKQDLHAQLDALHEQENALNEKLGSANDFDAAVAGRIVRDALTDKSVLIFRTPDARDDDVTAVARITQQARGVIAGTITLTQQFVDDDAAQKLGSIIESSIVPAGAQLSTKQTDPGSQAGDLLGIALLINRDPAIQPTDEAQRDTVLAALRDTGFVSYGDQHVSAANAAVVVTGGALGDDAGNQGVSVARFAAALAPHGAATVLAGRDGCASGTAAVAVARADAGLTEALSTVDNVDTEPGRITVVMATAEQVNGGRPGQYGTGHDAHSITVTH